MKNKYEKQRKKRDSQKIGASDICAKEGCAALYNYKHNIYIKYLS